MTSSEKSSSSNFSEIFNIENSNVSVSDIKYIVKSYKDIFIDYLVGISAGSGNIITYMSKQSRRNYKSYMKFSKRKEYMSLSNYIKNRNYVDV